MDDRFWSKVDRSGGLDACWPWVAARDPNGYGRVNRKVYGDSMAHRYVARQIIGAPENPEAVMHECDNPPCCNPLHLRPGTRLENNCQAWERGLHPLGEAHPRARLSDAQIAEIRRRCKAGERQRAVAAEFGIDPSHVSKIMSNDRRKAA